MPPEITRERLNFSQTRKVKWRYLSKKYDRFGRLFVVWLDRNNSEPTGQVERAFTAPIDIPDRFMKFPEDKPWRVELDLEGYARYLKHARQEWELRFEQIRSDRPKSESEEKTLRLVGPPPQDWRLIVLMSRGDPWCLGFAEKRTPAVISIIGPEPTAEELRREREKGPADLRLDPELEALIGGGVVAQFPDEVAESDAAHAAQARIPLRQHDFDDMERERRARMNAALDLQEEPMIPGGDDDTEEELTGDLALDDKTLADLDGGDNLDTLLNIEEQADPGATGGKKQQPGKNKTKPRE